jgi:hypothetical protein
MMFRGSDATQERVLTLIGGAVLLAVVAAVVAVLVNPFGGRPADRFTLTIDTPYVGQGVTAGTAVVLHGVEVGKVTNVALTPSGGVRLATELQMRPLSGLTDAVNIDFRPINYFGVPGVNIIPGQGGQAIRDGSRISVVPKGNFTLSELLSQLANVSAAALTPKLITVVDRVTRYTDAFNPLFETLLTVTKAVADVQRVPTAALLATTADISTAFPGFANELVNAGTRVADFSYYPEHGDPRGIFPFVPPPSSAAAAPLKLTAPFLEYVDGKSFGEETEEYYQNVQLRFLEIASGGFFASVGKLLGSHPDDLLPLVDGIKSLTDPVPALLKPKDVANTLVELRSRFEKLYAGNGEQRALQVRILLDGFPAVAAPLGLQGLPTGTEAGPPTALLPAEAANPVGAATPAPAERGQGR